MPFGRSSTVYTSDQPPRSGSSSRTKKSTRSPRRTLKAKGMSKPPRPDRHPPGAGHGEALRLSHPGEEGDRQCCPAQRHRPPRRRRSHRQQGKAAHGEPVIGQPEAPSTIGRVSLHGLLQSLGPQGRGRDESVERDAGQQTTDARRAGGAPLVPAAVREQEGHLATELRAEGRRIGPQQVRIRPHGQAQRRRRSLPHDRPPEGRSCSRFLPCRTRVDNRSNSAASTREPKWLRR